jgi:integrase
MADLTQELNEVNNRLTLSSTRMKVYLRGAKLYLQGTLPPKPGSEKSTAHQQYIALGITADQEGLKRAEAKAKEISALLDLGTFDWSLYIRHKEVEKPTKPERQLTVADWLVKFEHHYFTSRPRIPSKINTFEKNYLQQLSRMPESKPLSAELIKETILQSSQPGTRSRQLYVMAYGCLAKYAEIDVDLKPYDSNYSSKDVSPRDIPTEAEILAEINRLDHPYWIHAALLQATYGLRNHEIIKSDKSRLQEAPHILYVLDDSKTGRRSVYPSPSDWVTRFKLWEVPEVPFKKEVKASTCNNLIGEKFTKKFRDKKLNFNPYILRHAYACRLAALGVDVAVASRWMGHSVVVHCKTYHQFINASHNNRAWELMRHNEQVDLTNQD